MKRFFIILPLISALFLTFASCKEIFFTTDGTAWATSYHIVYKSPKNLDDSIHKIIAAIDNELSLFNPNSEVSTINDGVTDIVGSHFREVFEVSQRVNALSGGCYDVTIGPVAELWGFGRSDGSTVNDSLIAKALESVGMADCSLTGNRIIKKSPLTRFDFSSVAKGYGIDCIADMFERNGVNDYLIEIGGEIAVRGSNREGRQWHIQIDSPEGGVGHKALAIKALGPERMAIASSGNYRNFRQDSAGTTYGHTLSPLTGRPASTSVVAATVIHPSCAFADALATACMASGCADSAVTIIERAEAKALIVDVDKGVINMGVLE